MDARTRWTVWLSATIGSFLILEGLALREPLTAEKPSDTLTAYLRHLLGVQPVARRRWAAGAAFVAFWAWLCGHLLVGWPPNDLPRRTSPEMRRQT